MNLSDHFTLAEMTLSETAVRQGVDNTAPPEIVENLRKLVETMEQVRILLGRNAILVHSGYRSPKVNALVGGAPTSAHCRGLACDFTCPGYGGEYGVAVAISRSGIVYDQLIREYGWVHLGLRDNPRHELMTKRSAAAPYEEGINV